MMAPHHERLRVLHTALDAAGAELSDPIDRIEVRGGEVLFWTASERLAVSYDHEQVRRARQPYAGKRFLGG